LINSDIFLYEYMETFYRKKILFIYSLFLVIVSVLPVSEPQELEYLNADKAVHALFYLVFVLLYVFAFARSRFIYIKSFVCAFSLGLFIETLQYFIPYRSFDILDIAANSLGAAFGLLVAYKLLKQSRRFN